MTVLNQLIAELLEDAPKAKQYTEDDKAEILIKGLKKLRQDVSDLGYRISGLQTRRSMSGYLSQCAMIKDSFVLLSNRIYELDDPNLIDTQNNILNEEHKSVIVNSLKKSINAAIEEAIN